MNTQAMHLPDPSNYLAKPLYKWALPYTKQVEQGERSASRYSQVEKVIVSLWGPIMFSERGDGMPVLDGFLCC